MDEEGFPLPSLDGSHLRQGLRQDHESGETTAQRVVVFRRTPVPGSGAFSPHSVHKGCVPRSGVDCARTFHIQMDFLCTCPAGERNVGQSYGSENVRTPERSFRVPNEPSESHERNGAPTISVWREVFLGSSVFDYGSLQWKDISRMFPYPFWLHRYLSALRCLLPLGLLRLFHLLLLVLRLILRDVSIMGLYVVRLYSHLRIHQICLERGIQPVFTGKVCHGPITYGVRLRCTFCKHQREAVASLRYLQSMREEMSQSYRLTGKKRISWSGTQRSRTHTVNS